MAFDEDELRIVFLTEDIHTDSVGGVEQHVYHVARELSHLGRHVSIISMKAGRFNSREEELIYQSAGSVSIVKIVRKNIFYGLLKSLERHVGDRLGMLVALAGKLLPNAYFRMLVDEVMQQRPDLVHQHDYLASILATKLLAKKLPIVFTNHTGQYLYLERYMVTRYLQRWFLRHYAAIIGPSEELTPKNNRSTYISNGVDTDFFHSRSVCRNSETLTIICPRRWAPTKGVLYLARALALLGEDVLARIHVFFAGSDSDDFEWYREEILSVLNALPSSTYTVLGNLDQEELREYYWKSDMVVIPSLMEATSLAAMEGMSCGLPVLSTDVGGMPDVVEHEVTGWLVPPADPNALAEVVSDVVSKKYNLFEMGEAAGNFVREHKSWGVIAGFVDRVYLQHVGQTRKYH